jgi:hypothetical protein
MQNHDRVWLLVMICDEKKKKQQQQQQQQQLMEKDCPGGLTLKTRLLQ